MNDGYSGAATGQGEASAHRMALRLGKRESRRAGCEEVAPIRRRHVGSGNILDSGAHFYPLCA